jgi:hypothetical protein
MMEILRQILHLFHGQNAKQWQVGNSNRVWNGINMVQSYRFKNFFQVACFNCRPYKSSGTLVKSVLTTVVATEIHRVTVGRFSDCSERGYNRRR